MIKWKWNSLSGHVTTHTLIQLDSTRHTTFKKSRENLGLVSYLRGRSEKVLIQTWPWIIHSQIQRSEVWDPGGGYWGCSRPVSGACCGCKVIRQLPPPPPAQSLSPLTLQGVRLEEGRGQLLSTSYFSSSSPSGLTPERSEKENRERERKSVWKRKEERRKRKCSSWGRVTVRSCHLAWEWERVGWRRGQREKSQIKREKSL